MNNDYFQHRFKNFKLNYLKITSCRRTRQFNYYCMTVDTILSLYLQCTK